MKTLQPTCPNCGGTNIYRTVRAHEIAVLHAFEDDGKVLVYHTEKPFFKKMPENPVYHCDNCPTHSVSWAFFVPGPGVVQPGMANDDPGVTR